MDRRTFILGLSVHQRPCDLDEVEPVANKPPQNCGPVAWEKSSSLESITYTAEILINVSRVTPPISIVIILPSSFHFFHATSRYKLQQRLNGASKRQQHRSLQVRTRTTLSPTLPSSSWLGGASHVMKASRLFPHFYFHSSHFNYAFHELSASDTTVRRGCRCRTSHTAAHASHG